jgi:hypothetical protein
MQKGHYLLYRGKKSEPMFNLAITYRPAGGRPLIVATIKDRELLSVAAEAALIEAEQSTSDLSKADATLGAIQGLELAKLKRVLVALTTPSAKCSAVLM